MARTRTCTDPGFVTDEDVFEIACDRIKRWLRCSAQGVPVRIVLIAQL